MSLTSPDAKIHALVLVLLFCLAGFFATYHLTESPPTWYDEGFYVQSAANLATYGHTGLRIAPDTIEPSSKLITVGYPLIYPLAGWLKLFGVNILSARSLMVLFILGFLLASYVLARRLFGTGLALGALALLVTLPTLYGNGKDVLGEVPGLTFLILFLICFNRALSSTTRRYFWLALGALAAGLCVATKPTFLVLMPAIAVGTCIAWRRGTMHGKEILAAAAVGLVPILLWLLVQFNAGDSFSDVLSYYANPYQLSSLLNVILENVRRLFVGIGPLYLLGILGTWLYAFWIRLRRRETIPVIEIIALIFSLLIVAAYLRTAGWYRYLFEAQVIALLFFPNALLVAVQSANRFINAKKVVAIVISALTIFGAYQVMFSSFVAESYHRDKTAFLESYFATVPSTTSFFIYNVPEVAIFIRGANYYQYIDSYSGDAGWSIGREQLSVIEKGKVDRIIVGTDAYAKMEVGAFPRYAATKKTHDYTILEKI
jgi:4-amino-4-deoxy-L-arabinose transferase-like glycosyltransferase